MNEIQIKELFDRLETVEKSLKAVKQENETLKNGANRLNCAVHKIVQNLQKKTKEFEHSMKSFVEEKVEVSMDEVYAVKDEIQNSIDGLLFEMKQDRKTRKIMVSLIKRKRIFGKLNKTYLGKISDGFGADENTVVQIPTLSSAL
eukprot:TRINITY_DN68847_c1_g2_i1.p1 TRINITY_DN68847_c1_g2~~TRINITY_DN68847_c1_g2_i1.p1  ORF type:complete len:145 (-),score=11.43 TRINITY_DN68847_c1_g2_i1:74-508(-)